MEWDPTLPVSSLTGLKRPAESDPSEQPLAKRLELLSLRPPPSQRSKPARDDTNKIPAAPVREERMEVDNVVFIDSLSDEDDSDDENVDAARVVFISDIERELNRIPKHVLRGGGDDAEEEKAEKEQRSSGMELVLYSVPASLSVDEENDGVRRAIAESRARIREREEKSRGGAALNVNVDVDVDAPVPEASPPAQNGAVGSMQAPQPMVGSRGFPDGMATGSANGMANWMTNGIANGMANGMAYYGGAESGGETLSNGYDPDAMEIEL